MATNDRVIIFDTTLRDAEQTPGASLTVPDKMEIAKQLARLKVDVIEAGFPISSNEDFEAVHRIANEIEGPTICGLSRVVLMDIDRAAEALEGAAKPRIHTFVGTSKIHLDGQLRKGKAEVLEMAVKAVAHAKSAVDDVEFSPMDATRTDLPYLCEVVEATIAAGATTVNIPDTVGYTVPEEFAELIAHLKQNVSNIEQAVISVHCHDDLGMSVSNTLSALKAGARQVECTLNGLGERAGNASLEEVVMALRTRSDYYGLDTDIIAKEIVSTSRLVSRMMGIMVAPNKAIVGANAFAHSSGIHQDGVLKARNTFEIMEPTDVGWEATAIVLTARSGRHALRHRLETLGYKLSPEDLEKAYERFIELADKKKEVFDEDLMAIVGDEIRVEGNERYKLEYLHTVSGSGTVPSATVRLHIEGEEEVQQSAWGDGPVNAAYEAINLAAGVTPKVEEYVIQAITGGSQAMGEVTVRVNDGDLKTTGRGVSTDIIEASARAYVDALNRLYLRRGRQVKVRNQTV
ncbi:MAG: 2-isopropylmalate synthase [Gemmatimonadetes bacterium]|jgi:2-isopropylmalate synthase|nr:2-isopropylmalate synthase [Gemmatimonadota bacterium]